MVGPSKSLRIQMILVMILGFSAVGIFSNLVNPKGISFQRNPHIKQLGTWFQGEQVTFDFIIVNPDKKPHVIDRWAEDCSCAVSELTDHVIPAGGSIKMKTVLITATEEGKIRKRIRVYFEDGETWVYTLFAEVKPIFEIEPDKYIFMEVDRRKMEKTDYITTFQMIPVDERIRILDQEISEDHLDLTMIELEDGGGYEFTIRPKRSIPNGENQLELVLTIDHPVLGEYIFRYPIQVMVTDGFKIKPTFLSFGVITQAETDSIHLFSEEPFAVLDVYPCPSLEHIQIGFSHIEKYKGRAWKIDVTIDPDMVEEENIDGTVHIKTDHPIYPEITIPVIGKVLKNTPSSSDSEPL